MQQLQSEAKRSADAARQKAEQAIENSQNVMMSRKREFRCSHR